MLKIAHSLFRGVSLNAMTLHLLRSHSTLGTKIQLSSNVNNRLRLGEEAYCNDLSSVIQQPYNKILNELAKETEQAFEKSFMMISPLQAKLLHQLVCIFKPCRVLEIGGFTGYSAIAMGSALSLSSPNAKLISLESNIEHIRLASCYVQKAKLSSVISFIAGSAEDSIEKLHEMQRGKHEMFDFIFLDANKNAYTNYFDLIMRYDLLSDNGIMIVDNVLHWGQVHKEAGYEEAANRQKISKNVRKVASKVHKFNKHVKEDPRVDVVILPLFDGLSIIRKKHVS